MMRIEEEARKFMEDKLIIQEVITPDLYENLAGQTAIFPKDRALEYLALGMTSEAGEVAGKVKKLIRDGADKEDFEVKNVEHYKGQGMTVRYVPLVHHV